MATDITTSIDDFTSLVSEDCTGVPAFVAKKAVRAAAREFFIKTRIWREVFTGITVYPTDDTIDLNTVVATGIKNAIALEADDVWLSDDNTRLKKMNRTWMDKNLSTWRSDTAETPSGFFTNPKSRLYLYPALESDADPIDLDMELFVLPGPAIETYPDFLYDIYSETIAAGAKQRLMTQGGRPWTDPKRAALFFKWFHQGIKDAKIAEAAKAVEAANRRTRLQYR